MSVLVNFRIDEKLKKSVDKVCKELGITMSAAFNMFAKDLVKNKNISFDINKKLNTGIDMKKIYDILDNLSDISKKNSKTSSIDDNYFVNRIGNLIMLVPKNDPWAQLIDSSGKMTEDFMSERNQKNYEKREAL